MIGVRSLTLLAIIVAGFPFVAMAGGWKAGTAKVVITPTEPIWMAGYASRTKPAEGKVHDLWIRALAIEDPEGNLGVIVSCDVVGVSRQIWDSILERLDDVITRDQLMLNSSHTHSGPVMSKTLDDIYPLDDEQRGRVARYTTLFEEKGAQVIKDAIANLSPARISAGNGEAGFAVNRRNNPEASVTKLREEGALKGPIDHSVPVLSVRNEKNDLVAVVFAYACHNTTMDFYQWCGDYAGFAQDELEKEHPGLTAMFVSGCAGDQNPLPRRELALAQKYGKELATSVDAVLKGTMKELSPTLSTRLELVSIPLGQMPTREELGKVAAEAPGYQQRWAKRLLGELDAGRLFISSYDVPVQVWRVGDQLWIAVGGEVVVDYSLKFHKLFGTDAWVTAYANDVMAYIPSLRVLREGGYEGQTSMIGYGMPAYRWSEEIEDRLTTATQRLVKESNIHAAK